METLKVLWSGIDLPTTILCTTMIFLVVVISRWHRDNSDFDFRVALLDPETSKISFSRLGHFVSLVVSTSILLHETSKGRMTDWLFGGYMLAWAGTYVASKAIAAKQAGSSNRDNP